LNAKQQQNKTNRNSRKVEENNLLEGVVKKRFSYLQIERALLESGRKEGRKEGREGDRSRISSL